MKIMHENQEYNSKNLETLEQISAIERMLDKIRVKIEERSLNADQLRSVRTGIDNFFEEVHDAEIFKKED